MNTCLFPHLLLSYSQRSGASRCLPQSNPAARFRTSGFSKYLPPKMRPAKTATARPGRKMGKAARALPIEPGMLAGDGGLLSARQKIV
jgi:hypothetical protein